MTTDEHTADLAWQGAILQEVSRTFALTIPQLPSGLRDVVGNAYLLCRIADTIEDEPALSASEKREFSERFIRVVAGEEPPAPFAERLAPRLSDSMLPAERQLVADTPRVLRLTQGFSERQRAALVRCVRIMSRGMAEFQQSPGLKGLDDLPHLDRYCYHVAGVVGEMLTELFCDYSAEIDRQRDKLLQLAVSFGQGLQMTNILKDIWDDRARGACWLPRDVFQQAGFDLHSLEAGQTNAAFRTALSQIGRLGPDAPRQCAGVYVAHPQARSRHSSILSLGVGHGRTDAAPHPHSRGFYQWAAGQNFAAQRVGNRDRDQPCGTQRCCAQSTVCTVYAQAAVACGGSGLKLRPQCCGWTAGRVADSETVLYF